MGWGIDVRAERPGGSRSVGALSRDGEAERREMDPAASSTDGMFSMENDSLKLLDDLDESIANGTAGEFAGVNAQVGAQAAQIGATDPHVAEAARIVIDAL